MVDTEKIITEPYSLTKMQKFYLFWKRVIDFFGALLALLLLGWIMFIVFFINIFASKGHPIFRQQRVGKNGELFNLYKFRSMRVDAPSNVTSEELQNPYQYYTKFGIFIRKTSLDEWPQLFSILIGKMAFIGPRPVLNSGKDLITVNERKENGSIKLTPGMSGLSQISGRVNLSPDKRGSVDGEYYRKISFGLDVKIFFATIKKVFSQDDVIKDDKKEPKNER